MFLVRIVALPWRNCLPPASPTSDCLHRQATKALLSARELPLPIITTHMPKNDPAAPGHVPPGIRIHAIDIVQSPGIGISPIAEMEALQKIVTATLAAKSSAETPKKLARKRCIVRTLVPVAPTAPTTWLSS